MIHVLFFQQNPYLVSEFRKMIYNNCPYYLRQKAVITVYDKISCVDNLTRRCYLNIGVNFEDSVHGLTHNFYITFHKPTEYNIRHKHVEASRTICKLGLNLIDGTRAISERYFLTFSSIYQDFCRIEFLSEIRILHGFIANHVNLALKQMLELVYEIKEIVIPFRLLEPWSVKVYREIHIALIIETGSEYRAEDP